MISVRAWEGISNSLSLIGQLVGWVKRWTRATQQAIADGLSFISKDDPEICHHNFDPPQKRWLPCFDIPRGTMEWEFGGHCTRVARQPGKPGEPGKVREKSGNFSILSKILEKSQILMLEAIFMPTLK